MMLNDALLTVRNMRTIEATGKSVDAAIFNGLQELGISIDEVRIEILQTETKGILGIGAKPAKVRLTELPPEEVTVPDFKNARDQLRREKQEHRDRRENHERKEKRDNLEKPEYRGTYGRDDQNVNKNEYRQSDHGEMCSASHSDAVEQAVAPLGTDEQPNRGEYEDACTTENSGKAYVSNDASENKNIDMQAVEAENTSESGEAKILHRSGSRSDARRSYRDRQYRDNRESRGSFGEDETVDEPKRSEYVPAAEITYTEEAAQNEPAVDFVKGLLDKMGIDAKVLAAKEEGIIHIRIDSKPMGIVIGHRGETLDSIQYLTSLVINRNRKTDGYTRVSIDTEGYREKREETLTRLARRVGQQVKATGRARVLEPMNPYERRILHSALQNNPYVTTHSEGDEPNRRVVVTPKRRTVRRGNETN